MADEVEKLLELAFKAEKFGDRAEAIRLYRQVAITDPDNATYASNCADELEKLGVATPAPQASIADTDITNASNPFQTPTTPGVPNIEAIQSTKSSGGLISLPTSFGAWPFSAFLPPLWKCCI